MREYIKKKIDIDGRNIPYPVYTAVDYIIDHDGLSGNELEEFFDKNQELCKRINQIIAIKQSCYLLRRVSHSCQSLSDDMYQLKLELIKDVSEKYDYIFDDEWMESLVSDYI